MQREEENLMNGNVSISHVGLFVRDMSKMKDFFTNVLGFAVTDEEFPRMVFLSRNPAEHHQIGLFPGRDTKSDVPQVQQLSFRLDSLGEVKKMHDRLAKAGVKDMNCLSHGIAWSIYFRDPEGNRLEFFTDTEWYVKQPCADPIDFSLSEEEIYRQTETLNRTHAGFQPFQQWREEFSQRLAEKLAAMG
jgi:catechol 2,3-dioxygenase